MRATVRIARPMLAAFALGGACRVDRTDPALRASEQVRIDESGELSLAPAAALPAECTPGQVVTRGEGDTWQCDDPAPPIDLAMFGACDEGDVVVGIDAETGAVRCAQPIDLAMFGACDVGDVVVGIDAETGAVQCAQPESGGGGYTAGAGLVLDGDELAVDFAGDGEAVTAARSDHTHPPPAEGVEALRAEIEAADFCPRLVDRDGDRRVYQPVFDTPGVVRCRSGDDELVKVGAFWIDRYEAVLVPPSYYSDGACDGAGDPYGAAGGASPADDYPDTFPDTGHWSAPVYACSVAGEIPSRMMTWFQAEQACALAGKRLCSNAEWQAAVAGTVDPGVHDGSVIAPCHTGALAPRMTGMAGESPGAASGCVSRWGAEDMIGNLWEWVAEWLPAGPTAGIGEGDRLYPWPADPGWGGDVVENVDGVAYWEGSGLYVRGVPAALLRGGDWDGGARPGAFAFGLRYAPHNWRRTHGVRCCAGR